MIHTMYIYICQYTTRHAAFHKSSESVLRKLARLESEVSLAWVSQLAPFKQNHC